MEKKILDFSPSKQSDVIERILFNVHRNVDLQLPDADTAPVRFSKTVFNDDESTGLVKAAIEYEKKLESDEAVKAEQIDESSIEDEGEKRHVSNSPTSFSGEELGINFNEHDSNVQTQNGTAFSQMYSSIDNKAVRGSKDLLMIISGIVVLSILAAGYWYLFET